MLALLGGGVEAVAWRSGSLMSRRVPAAELFGPSRRRSRSTSWWWRQPSRRWRRAPAGRWTSWRRHDYALAGVVLTVTVDGDGSRRRAGPPTCRARPRRWWWTSVRRWGWWRRGLGDRVRPRRLVAGPDRRHPRHRLPPAPGRHAHRAGRRPCPHGPGPAPNRNLRRLAMPSPPPPQVRTSVAGSEGRTVSEAPCAEPRRPPRGGGHRQRRRAAGACRHAGCCPTCSATTCA